MEQLKAFIEKAKSDKELEDKLTALHLNNAAAEEYVTLAADNGFTITADEFNERKKKRKLSEEQLEEVAGGFGKGDNGTKCYFTPTGKTKDIPVPEKGYIVTWAECNSWCVGFAYDCSCHKINHMGEAICVNKWHQLHGGTELLWPDDQFNHRWKKPPTYNT